MRTRPHTAARIGVRAVASSMLASPEPPIDLRRKSTTKTRAADVQRELAELVVASADHLPESDAALVLAVYRDGVQLIQLAAAGRPQGDLEAGSMAYLRRRLRRITERCADPIFAFVATRRETLPPNMRRVATACVLHGMSVRRAAIVLNMSQHAVRRHRESLQAIFISREQPARPTSAPPPAAPKGNDQ